MKKIILSLSGALFLIGCTTYPPEPKETITVAKNAVFEQTPTRFDTIIAMATAFARQESRCNEHAVSYDGKYVGCLQIGTIMVDEANRLLGGKYFWCDTTYIDDRLDWNGSLGIFSTIMEYKNPTLDIDRAVDIWNVHAPNSYRNNVKKYYQEELEKLPYGEKEE